MITSYRGPNGTNLSKPSQHSASLHSPSWHHLSETRVSRESVWTPVAVSTAALPLQGDSSLIEVWPASGEPGFNHSMMGQVHLAQDTVQPSSLGTGPALTPNLLASEMRVGEKCRAHPRSLQCRTVGT